MLSDPTPPSRPADGPDGLQLRSLAGHIRQHTVDHLDHYLATATAAVQRRGGTVHWAADAEQARRIVAELGGGPAVPSAIVAEVSPTATGTAAVAGAAFVVAETGQVCLAGDGADVPAAAAAAVLVCLAGIEQVVPRGGDLAVMLKLTARAATGRPMAGYTALVDGTRRALHLVWVDNGRSTLLAGEHRAALRCIGCGACTAVCPVYRAAGAEPAGLWAGPIGAIVLPVVRGGANDLPHASTLCGACADVCPVRIDLPAHLIALRRASPVLRRRLRLWAWIVTSPTRYRWATRWQRWRHRRATGGWPAAAAASSFHDQWRARGRRV